ncbi:ATP synthase subunit I [Sinimarinibacterium sp. NLF-5-8]|uniref:ATP synthase subunit I n=1 Tax=Sinimarinibacterium sp. NLF-5-8 TaxID=2698684 RepID=UPI00137BE82E|nr:ATP synthase subunit I [Sinimarinibacterium sp. NLF-5-8]QHS10397.1 hypothetical protein GT972_09800 [Sinimarinibacterium sp. NLF-5-8]
MKTAIRIARLQGLIGLVSAGVYAVTVDQWSALAALTGGVIGALLTIYAGAKAFSVSAEDPQQAVTKLFRAEVRKWLLAVVLFAVAVRVFGQAFAPVIITFALTLSIYWFALLWDKSDG